MARTDHHTRGALRDKRQTLSEFFHSQQGGTRAKRADHGGKRRAIRESLDALSDALTPREIAFAHARGMSPDCESVCEAYMV